MELPGPLNDEQSKQLRIVQSSGRHLLSLINDLLDLARIEAGKRRAPHRADRPRRSCSRRSAARLRPARRGQGPRARRCSSGRPAESETDRRALRQILINLANNAIKFTDEGCVRLELTHAGEDGAQVTRVQRDRHRARHPRGGSGAAVRRLRADRRRRRRQPYEGTGLGPLHLPDAGAAARRRRSRSRASSAAGSTFTLEVPEQDACPAARILVVEDNEDN